MRSVRGFMLAIRIVSLCLVARFERQKNDLHLEHADNLPECKIEFVAVAFDQRLKRLLKCFGLLRVGHAANLLAERMRSTVFVPHTE